MPEFDVVIVGAGPAGLAFAADFGRRGRRCLVVEKRSQPTKHPRATLLGARSMEYYRRFGLQDKILKCGLPIDFPYDVIFATTLSGHVLYHYSSPSPADHIEMQKGNLPSTEDSRVTPYFKVQIGQHALEPIVRDYAAQMPNVEIRYGWEMRHFDDRGDQVHADIAAVGSEALETMRARYLIACDGGSSQIRETLGIPYTGRGAMRRNISFLFRSKDFLKHATVGRANLYFLFSPGNFGVFTMIDGEELWNYQHYVLDDGTDVVNVDPVSEIKSAMGEDFEFEVLRTMHWQHHQSVANEYRRGNVFLVGDAAHLFCPTGGVGMNTAIGDAFDLSWKIDAVLSGWGGEMLLDSYEAERRPIGFRNTIAAASNADRVDSMMLMTPEDIETPEAVCKRKALEPRFRWLSRQFRTTGLHIGYRYVDSPVVVPDGTPEPPDDPRIAQQTTWPGFRAPHAWTGPDQTTLDNFDGSGFVLVIGDARAEAGAFADAAAQMGIPFKTVRFTDPELQALYERRYVLVRPDGHVCWRGDELPGDAGAILSTVTGR